MAKSNESFNRREREAAKKSKAEAKRQRRLAKPEPELTVVDAPSPVVDEGVIIQQLADLNVMFDAGDLEFEEFDRRRGELLSRLSVE